MRTVPGVSRYAIPAKARGKLAACVFAALLILGSMVAATAQDALKAEGEGESPTLTLRIGVAPASPGQPSIIPITLIPNGGAGPATIAFSIEYNAADLSYVSLTPGEAAIAAGKDVVPEASDPGVVRCLIWGTNQNVISAGDLLWVTFQVGAGVPAGSLVTVNLSRPSAADPDANPIAVVTTTAACLPAPENVVPSVGRTDGIAVSWDGVDDATGYQVYRGETDNPAAAVPLISGWLGARDVIYLDATAEAATTSSGCLAPASTAHARYYYWVRARRGTECLGNFSLTTSGSRARPESGGTLAGDVLAYGFAVSLMWGFSVWRRRGRGRAV